MKRVAPLAATLALVAAVPAARAYVEVPYSLGRICNESTHIVLVEVVKVAPACELKPPRSRTSAGSACAMLTSALKLAGASTLMVPGPVNATA